jgi:hypothetical protein
VIYEKVLKGYQQKEPYQKSKKHEKMANFRPKNRFFGNKTGFHSVSRPETVINRFSGQKYII